jgi:stage II sporulation protein D
MIVPADKKIDVPLGDYYKKEIKVELPPYQEKNFITDTENIRRVHGRAGEIISFSGFGWGHGLGLSQWGAKAMAEKFAVNKNGDFKDILNHYYKNIEIKKIY